MATSDGSGSCDVSPKCDPPGFAHVLNDCTIAIPGRLGNRRADSFHNVLENGHVGNLGTAVTAELTTLDLNNDGTLSAADANTLITTLVETSNDVLGTFPGDLNFDGTVDVLGDAFSLIGNLGNADNPASDP